MTPSMSLCGHLPHLIPNSIDHVGRIEIDCHWKGWDRAMVVLRVIVMLGLGVRWWVAVGIELGMPSPAVR